MNEGGSQPALFAACQIEKHYASPVLSGVDLQLAAGEIRALIGANGAGKSTLSKIISGLVVPTAGEMYLDGQVYAPGSKRDAERAGVQIVQQELNLVAGLSVAENLFLNRLPHRLGCLSLRRLYSDAERALQRVGLEEIPPIAPIESLGVGQQQLVEIAAALSRDCRVLILDEPTAALTDREIERLFTQLRQLRADGTAMIYISHRLDEIRAIADSATVLRDGQVVLTSPIAELSVTDMVRQMVGEVATATRCHRSFAGAPVLRVNAFSRAPVFENVSFTVHRGERLGIAGLVGSGRTELLRAIFGADPVDSGELWLGDHSQPQRFQHPRQAVAAGLAMVTEDRKQDGLLLSKSVRLNTSVAFLNRFRRALGWLDQSLESADANRLAAELQIKCESVEQSVEELSGGNQQKVVVAKWLLRDAEILLLDEPSRGIDIGARAQLYRQFDELAGRGKTLVIVSSELQELMDLCDRILVMSAGRLTAEFARDQWSEEKIMAAAFEGYLQTDANRQGADA